jgi:hypothetical protein
MLPISEVSAEIFKKIWCPFGRFEDIKTSFQDLLTFNQMLLTGERKKTQRQKKTVITLTQRFRDPSKEIGTK